MRLVYFSVDIHHSDCDMYCLNGSWMEVHLSLRLMTINTCKGVILRSLLIWFLNDRIYVRECKVWAYACVFPILVFVCINGHAYYKLNA